jgi:hypothetical protein
MNAAPREDVSFPVAGETVAGWGEDFERVVADQLAFLRRQLA